MPGDAFFLAAPPPTITIYQKSPTLSTGFRKFVETLIPDNHRENPPNFRSDNRRLSPLGRERIKYEG
jgi:hypothetical protein